MSSLVCTKSENLQTMETRDDIMVFTHMRGAVIPTSVSKGFLRACTLRSVAYSSTYSFKLISFIMKQLIESLRIKNLFAIFFTLLLLLASCTQRNKFQDSYVIEVDGKKGLIDSLGNVIVEPRFVEITPIMRNGYATVVIDTIMMHRCDTTILSNTYEVIKVKYGYVNGSDKFLFQEPSFSEIKVPAKSNKDHLLLDFCENHSFSNGLAVVENKTFLCGYRNLKGDTIIPCIYSDAKIFSENRAVVQKPFLWDTIKNRVNPDSNKYGFIDNNGKEVSKFNFISLNTLRRNRSIGVIGYTSYNDDGYEIEGALEKNADGSITIDKSKRRKIEGDGSPELGWSIYLVDENSNIIKQLSMLQSYSNFSDDDIVVAIPNLLGDFFCVGFDFIDKNGNNLKPLAGLSNEQLDSLSQLDLVRAALPQKNNILDATRFTNGFAAVKLGDEAWAFVDRHLIVYGKEGEEVFQDAGPFSNGIAAVKKNSQWGYIDDKFDFVIPCQYDSCCQAGRNLSKVYQSQDKVKITSYIDRNNKIVWQNTEYNQISLNREDNSKPKSDWGKWNIVDYEQESATSYLWLIILIIIVFIFSITFLVRKNRKKRKALKNTPIPCKQAEDSKGKVIPESASSQVRPTSGTMKKSNETVKPSVSPNHSKAQLLTETQKNTNLASSCSSAADKSSQINSCFSKPNNKGQILSVINDGHQPGIIPEQKIFQTNYPVPNVKQKEGYYCFVLFPKTGTTVFPYRRRRIEKRGYTETGFETKLRAGLVEFINYKVLGDVCILPVEDAHPYEPDIAIIEKEHHLGIRIDIEIDEPYTGYEQKAIHFIGCGDEYRDANLCNLGWIVIRFSEKQVYTEAEKCIGYIKHVLSLIDSSLSCSNFVSPQEDKKWTSTEAVIMAAKGYREAYLHHQFNGLEDADNAKLTTSDIKQTKLEKEAAKHVQTVALPQNKILNIDDSATKYSLDNRIRFEPKEHIYVLDGILQLKAVSDVIAHFFRSFNILEQSKLYAYKNGMSQTEVIEIWDAKGVESRNVGTFLHEQIENYLKGEKALFDYSFEYNGEIVNYKKAISIEKEFGYFLDFMRDSEVKPFRSEWRIFDEKNKIAGTIDLICRNGSLFDIYDWKRSTKASPNETVWQHGINGLEHIPDISFYKYALQQNLYKYILESNYGIKINKMYLIVLHYEYERYVKYEVPRMDKEITIILNSLN